MPERAKYEAFISYSHTDDVWAAWLHKALERYRLPKYLAKELGRERRSRPLFRDRDELASSRDLSESLKRAMDDASALIVICSPAAAKSAWVNAEIDYFASLGRTDRIFCLIVDGTIESSIPPALTSKRDVEPLAADPKVDGRRNAKLKIVAGLLGIGLDMLKQRDKQWRRRVVATQAGALTAVAAATSFAVFIATRTPPCAEPQELMAEIWNVAQREQIETSFLGTELPYATETLQVVQDTLSRYAGEWAGMHSDACKATKVRREQSERLLDLRMACLDQRRRSFVGLRTGLQIADTNTIENAVASLGRLHPLARCADREVLEASYPLPEDSYARQRIEAAYSSIATIQSQLDGVDVEQAVSSAKILTTSISTYDYPPIETEALILLGDSYVKSGDIALAKDTFFEAAAKAARANDPELAARAWLALPRLLSRSGATEDAFRMLRFAQSYVDQVPKKHILRAEYLRALGSTKISTSDHAGGITDLQQAVELVRTLGGHELPKYLSDLAWALRSDHRVDEAHETTTEAANQILAIYGSTHPQVAKIKYDLGYIESLRGNHQNAIGHFEEAIQIHEAIFPSNHVGTAPMLITLGWELISVGSYPQSIAAAKRAIAILDQQLEPLWPSLGSAHNVVGDAYLSSKEFGAARTHFKSSLAAWREVDDDQQASIVLNNLGNLSNREGRFDLAIEPCTEALKMDESRLRDDHPSLAYPLSCLGEAFLGLTELDKALDVLERSHALRDNPEVNSGALAWSRWLLGRALWEKYGSADRSLKYLRFAFEVFSDMGDGADLERRDMEAWLTRNKIKL